MRRAQTPEPFPRSPKMAQQEFRPPVKSRRKNQRTAATDDTENAEKSTGGAQWHTRPRKYGLSLSTYLSTNLSAYFSLNGNELRRSPV